jgi:hypothetical protein
MKYKPYTKVITTKDYYGECAIYEPHPFRDGAVKDAVEQSGHIYNTNTGIDDDEWCWVFYDWCANPVGLSDEKPDGEVVDKFTAEHFYGYQHLADYLNEEPVKSAT